MEEIKTKNSKIYYKDNDNTYREVGRVHSISYDRQINPFSLDYPIKFTVEGNLYTDKIIDELNRVIRGDNTKNQNKKVPMPKKYIINKGATVLIWDNGEKTIVKRCEDDEFNKRLGFLTAFFQHYCGMSKNKANKFLAELEVEDEEIKTTKAKHMKGE